MHLGKCNMECVGWYMGLLLQAGSVVVGISRACCYRQDRERKVQCKQDDSACAYKQGKSAQYEQDTGLVFTSRVKAGSVRVGIWACCYKHGRYKSCLLLQAG